MALRLNALQRLTMSPSSHHKKVISKDTHIEYLRGDVLKLKDDIEDLKAENYALLIQNKNLVDSADDADSQIVRLKTIISYLESQIILR